MKTHPCQFCGASDGKKHHPDCAIFARVAMGIGGAEANPAKSVIEVCKKCKGKGFVITDILCGSTKKCDCQREDFTISEEAMQRAKLIQPANSPNVPHRAEVIWPYQPVQTATEAQAAVAHSHSIIFSPLEACDEAEAEEPDENAPCNSID